MTQAVALNALFALAFVGLWSAVVWLIHRSLGEPAVRAADAISASPEFGLGAGIDWDREWTAGIDGHRALTPRP
jgi:hypothetical protein